MKTSAVVFIEKFMPACLSLNVGELLSLTLQDAQHLSWKTFKKLEAFGKTPATKYYSEPKLRETAAEITELEQSGLNDSENKKLLSRKLSELLFACFVVAERSGISLEDAFLANVDELILGFVS
jgi:hypothetical protein